MHGECYRRGNGQPYTRKEYIKGKPQIKITKFQSGSADRLQEGMRRAFGKAVSLAARVKRGQCIMEMQVKKEHLEAAKKALKGACVKLPGTPTIRVVPLNSSKDNL